MHTIETSIMNIQKKPEEYKQTIIQRKRKRKLLKEKTKKKTSTVTLLSLIKRARVYVNICAPTLYVSHFQKKTKL